MKISKKISLAVMIFAMGYAEQSYSGILDLLPKKCPVSKADSAILGAAAVASQCGSQDRIEQAKFLAKVALPTVASQMAAQKFFPNSKLSKAAEFIGVGYAGYMVYSRLKSFQSRLQSQQSKIELLSQAQGAEAGVDASNVRTGKYYELEQAK